MMSLLESPHYRKLLRQVMDAGGEVQKSQSFNASLIKQLASANERIATLENRLRGDNEIRRIALVTGISQEVVVTQLTEWIRMRRGGLQ